jgi:hypothetical protein
LFSLLFYRSYCSSFSSLGKYLAVQAVGTEAAVLEDYDAAAGMSRPPLRL